MQIHLTQVGICLGGDMMISMIMIIDNSDSDDAGLPCNNVLMADGLVGLRLHSMYSVLPHRLVCPFQKIINYSLQRFQDYSAQKFKIILSRKFKIILSRNFKIILSRKFQIIQDCSVYMCIQWGSDCSACWAKDQSFMKITNYYVWKSQHYYLQKI